LGCIGFLDYQQAEIEVWMGAEILAASIPPFFRAVMLPHPYPAGFLSTPGLLMQGP
jgi:hypothetical protein